MQKAKMVFVQLCDIAEIIVEVVLLAFSLFILFPHIQDTYHKALAPKIIHVWGEVWSEMNLYPEVYIPFIVLFVLWIILKIFRLHRDNREQERLSKTLSDISSTLERINDRLDDYEKKIIRGEQPRLNRTV